MDTVLKADIFFFVTTIVVAIFGIFGAIICVYFIKILRNINRATARLESEIEALGENADALYHTIRESFLFSLLFGKRAKK